jgi:hypothetical protein
VQVCDAVTVIEVAREGRAHALQLSLPVSRNEQACQAGSKSFKSFGLATATKKLDDHGHNDEIVGVHGARATNTTGSDQRTRKTSHVPLNIAICAGKLVDARARHNHLNEAEPGADPRGAMLAVHREADQRHSSHACANAHGTARDPCVARSRRARAAACLSMGSQGQSGGVTPGGTRVLGKVYLFTGVG